MTKIITIGQTEMIRVGRDYPCPICGKPELVSWFLQINLKQSVLERLTRQTTIW